MSDLENRMKRDLEPVLELADPRERISAYHDMPYALFRYEPDEEFDLRKQVTLLETRLTQKGKRVKRHIASGVPGRSDVLAAATPRLVCGGA